MFVFEISGNGILSHIGAFIVEALCGNGCHILLHNLGPEDLSEHGFIPAGGREASSLGC